jgi:hypothetical protein
MLPHGFGTGHPILLKLLAATAAVFVLSAAAGCLPRRTMVREMADIMADGTAAYEQDDDLEMLESAFPANIKLLEALLVSDPDNEQLLVLLSRMIASYTYIFLEEKLEAAAVENASRPVDAESLKQRAAGYYQNGIEYALRALAVRHPQSRRDLALVTAAGDFIRSLKTADAPALYWYGFSLSGYINLRKDSVAAVARAHLVEKAMGRVLELDPGYFFGGAHLVLMAYYGSRSPMLGGSPARVLEHYHALKTLHGDRFKLTDVFYARYYLYPQQDRRQFQQVLEAVGSQIVDEPRFRLLNRVAVDRARIYLERIDRFFPS